MPNDKKDILEETHTEHREGFFPDTITWKSPWKAEKKVPPPWGIDLPLECAASVKSQDESQPPDLPDNEEVDPQSEQQNNTDKFSTSPEEKSEEEPERAHGTGESVPSDYGESRKETNLEMRRGVQDPTEPPAPQKTPGKAEHVHNIFARKNRLCCSTCIEWSNQNLVDWETYNVSLADNTEIGTSVIRLGAESDREAYIHQDIVVLPERYYEIKCTLRPAETNSSPPEIKLLWLDTNRNTVGEGLVLRVNPNAKPHFQTVTGVTEKSPGNVIYARISFSKLEKGTLDLNSFTLTCL